MPKTNQSPVLGALRDFRENPSSLPDSPPDEDLEARVSNLEQAVNQILLQLSDLSEELDRPRKDQVFETRITQKQQKKQPPKTESQDTPPPVFQSLSPQETLALADRIYELLSDGIPRSKTAIVTAVECNKADYDKTRKILIKTGRMQKGNDLVAGQICNVPNGLAVWTQEQIDAELKRREITRAKREEIQPQQEGTSEGQLP